MRVFAPTFAFLCRPPRLAFAVLAFPSLAFPSLAAFLAASVVLAFWRWLVMHARFPFSRPLRAIIARCLGTVAAIAVPIDSTAIRVPLDSTSFLLWDAGFAALAPAIILRTAAAAVIFPLATVVLTCAGIIVVDA